MVCAEDTDLMLLDGAHYKKIYEKCTARDIQKKFTFLRSMPMFGDIRPTQILALAQLLKNKRYARNEVYTPGIQTRSHKATRRTQKKKHISKTSHQIVFKQGAKADGVYLVNQGVARVIQRVPADNTRQGQKEGDLLLDVRTYTQTRSPFTSTRTNEKRGTCLSTLSR
jgi:hypothetical protein